MTAREDATAASPSRDATATTTMMTMTMDDVGGDDDDGDVRYHAGYNRWRDDVTNGEDTGKFVCAQRIEMQMLDYQARDDIIVTPSRDHACSSDIAQYTTRPEMQMLDYHAHAITATSRQSDTIVTIP